MHPLASPPARTLYALATLVALPYALPPSLPLLPGGRLRVESLRLLDARASPQAPETSLATPAPSEGETPMLVPTDDRGADTPAHVAAPSPLAFAAPATATPSEGEAPPHAVHPIDDPSGHALDAYCQALARVDARVDGAKARILYFGDSIVSLDWVTSTLRHKLQQRFGDAGHGFVLLGNPWPGYAHVGVKREASDDWGFSSIVGPFARDGLYGLGGVSFVARHANAMARVSTVDKGDLGRRVSRFTVTYAQGPTGSDLHLRVDDGEWVVVPTRSDDVAVKAYAMDVPDGPHKLELRTTGPARLFGFDLERNEPGAIVDALGVIGLRLRFLDKSDDAAWAEELRRRSPAMIAFAFGANESEDGFAYPIEQLEETARAVYKQARDAVPEASCLIVGPLDSAHKGDDGVVRSREIVPAMIAVQRRLADELGCAFFDTYRAMGGAGSMGRWSQRGLGGSDLVHPSGAGAETIGGWLYAALLDRYEAYRRAATPAAR